MTQEGNCTKKSAQFNKSLFFYVQFPLFAGSFLNLYTWNIKIWKALSRMKFDVHVFIVILDFMFHIWKWNLRDFPKCFILDFPTVSVSLASF